ncbi:hypothetical protein FQN54_004682 [Arachnomyces sp. PD_36]|nr:hypothetical protein FQN54_004682 [Arachnomyces sp. PD_36]
MLADFWAGYLSGAIGIVIGNPLDAVKVRLQANSGQSQSHTGSGSAGWQGFRGQFDSTSSLVRGATAPILGYGALNALLFVAYNRTLMLLDPSVTDPTNPQGVPLQKIWIAGAAGGLASWAVSAPTELIKCRAQLGAGARGENSSWAITKDIFRRRGLRGFYFGGGVTSVRDSVGYGFYFWSYEFCKRLMTVEDETAQREAMKVLLCGGIAGIATWASVFPLDVIKTRIQAQTPWETAPAPGTQDRQSLLRPVQTQGRALGAFEIAREAYRAEGLRVFYRGLGICSLRAFIVNAVQWATYEWIMKALT